MASDSNQRTIVSDGHRANTVLEITPEIINTKPIPIEGTDKDIYVPDCIHGKTKIQEYYNNYFGGNTTRNTTLKISKDKVIPITVPAEIEYGDSAKIIEFYERAYKSVYKSYYHYRDASHSPRSKKGGTK